MDEEYEEYDESWTGRIVIAAVVAVALIAGAFFVGRAMASGPATLAEAVQQAQAGDLPCGDVGGAATPDPAATPGAGGPPGGGAFMARAICGGDGQQPAGGAGGPGLPGGAQGARGRFGFGGQTGRVVSVTDTTLMLEGPGGNREVQLSPETKVNTTTEGAASDLKAGQTVIVSGGGQGGQGTATSVLILPAADAG